MSKVNSKKLLYVVLIIAALVLYWKIFSKVSGNKTLEPKRIEKLQLIDDNSFFLFKEKEPMSKIINPFYQNSNAKKKIAVKQMHQKRKNVVLEPKHTVESKIRPNVAYHGTIISDKFGVSAYITLDGKMHVVKQNLELKDGIFVKNIWTDSIKLRIYDKDEVIYR